MDKREKVTRLRQLIVDAARRGCAESRTEEMQRALHDARQARWEPHTADGPKAPYPIRRRMLLSQIGLKMKHYDLRDEVDAFVYESGHETLHGLDIEELDALNTWMARCVDDQQAACDSRYAPPAR